MLFRLLTLVKNIGGGVAKYPVIKVEDIEILCIHYKNAIEAVSAWNRRRKRVNPDNVLIIGNSWDCNNNLETINKLLSFHYKTVFFDYNCLNGGSGFSNNIRIVALDKNEFRYDSYGYLKPSLVDFCEKGYKRYYEKYFDFVDFMNEIV